MKIIGTAVLAIVAAHAAHTFHRHSNTLSAHHAAARVEAAACSAPATAIAIRVLWPATAMAPISPMIGHWHATVNAIGY